MGPSGQLHTTLLKAYTPELLQRRFVMLAVELPCK